ncbi:MAG TPA: SIS domain-containing protein [Gaiellaceae bacterium]
MHGLWQDVLELPGSLQTTLDRSDGFADVAAELRRPAVDRVVATGNGAAFYVALGLGLASLETAAGPPVAAVPAGLIAAGRFAWRPGDLLLAVSSSGELRDLVDPILADRLPVPYVTITSSPESTIARGARARALVHVLEQRAVTHTQAYCGNVAAALAVWAAATDDAALAAAVAGAPEAIARRLDALAPAGADAVAGLPTAAIAFGAGAGWAAALETALLLKEVSCVPAEGQEAREGATSGMMGLRAGCLAVGIRTGSPLDAEAELQCAERGATVVAIDGGREPRLAQIASFPESVALAIALAERAGLDVDDPDWTAAYYRTARTNDDVAPAAD